MAKAGRKSWTEELEIAERYSALSVPFFKFIKKMLDSPELADQKWAAERLEKAFVKMIPQDLTSGGKTLPTPIISLHALQRNDSDSEDTVIEA